MQQQENTSDVESHTKPFLFTTHLKFAFNNYRWPIILTALFLGWVLIDASTGWSAFDNFKTRWNAELDPIVSLATLMIALFVWYGEITEDWKNNLPKRLNARFENEQHQLVMLCKMAHLSDVADIRALGQQIARQMCGGDIHFRVPYVKQNPGEILHDPEIGYFLHYQVTFTLTKKPDGLPEGKCKLWKAPFKAEDITFEDSNSC